RAVQPGEPDRAAQERAEGFARAGEYLAGQRGVHGDRVPGVLPEGVAGASAPRPAGPGDAAELGVQGLPGGAWGAALARAAPGAAAGLAAAGLQRLRLLALAKRRGVAPTPLGLTARN